MPLWQLVRRVSESYGRRLQEHKKDQPGSKLLSSVSVQQFQYLQAISRMDRPTVGRLAEYFSVTPPTATVIVRRLEDQGLIRKKIDADDARIQHITLTEKGQRLLSVQEGAFKALAGDISHILTKEELRRYSELTEKICRAFEPEENQT